MPTTDSPTYAHMDRREFIKGLLKLGISLAVADKLELFERLTHKRKFFPGHRWEHKTYALGFSITQEMLEDDIYGERFLSMYKTVKIPPLIHADGRLEVIRF